MLKDFASLHNLILPDAWQADAISALKSHQDVIIAAPTGAGKTYVFEKFFSSANLNRQAIYTVPTRALANDKYAEWKKQNWRVGLATGDLAIDTGAPLLVATLESVLGVAFRKPYPSILVVDEYQWIRDEDRGNHYEGIVYSLPKEIQLLFLSGSVANPQRIADWLVRLGRNATVVSHEQRPVPLEEFDVDRFARTLPASIEGFWTRRLGAALRHDLGPVLVFAPHRQDAERLARQAARELPIQAPLTLSEEQRKILGKNLTALVEKRIAYHHSGLTYEQRAGVIEPLAKRGQLRIVVATLGLSAGINFSMRSVLITAQSYQKENIQHDILPHELLQMIGRAGRRGIDETGYLLISNRTPRLNHAAPIRLKRASALPWTFLLRDLARGVPTWEASAHFAQGLFSEEPLPIGLPGATARPAGEYPCAQGNETARARLVRRRRRPFRGCKKCVFRGECLNLDPSPTLLWQWTRIGLLNRKQEITERGRLASLFLGAEGLAIAAALEDKKYPIDDLIFHLADLFGGGRFCENEARWSGRLAMACQRAYGRFSIDGFLQWGIPPNYGIGASGILEELLLGDKRRGQLTGEYAKVGDIDRLLTEWRSLLRQIIGAPAIPENARWNELKEQAQHWLGSALLQTVFPVFPPLSAEQMKPVSHRLRW